MIAECAVRVRRSLIGCLDESAILDIELGVAYQVNVDVHRAGLVGVLLTLDGHPFAYSAPAAMEIVINGGPEVKRKRSLIGCLDESAILDIELGVAHQVNVDVHRADRLGLL